MDERPNACPACRGDDADPVGPRLRPAALALQYFVVGSSRAPKPRGKPAALKLQAIELYCLGLSMNAVAKRVGVSAKTMLRWVRDHAQRHCPKPEPTGKHGRGRDRRGLALRRKKSNKLWIWKAFERGTGRLIDWECGGRDQVTLERLLERLEPWGVRLFAAAPTTGRLTTPPCRSGDTTSARTRRSGARATTRASGTGSPASAVAPAWSPARSRWSMPPWPCSPSITATAANSGQR